MMNLGVDVACGGLRAYYDRLCGMREAIRRNYRGLIIGHSASLRTMPDGVGCLKNGTSCHGMGLIPQRVARNVAGSALHGVGEQPVGGGPRRANRGCPVRAEVF